MSNYLLDCKNEHFRWENFSEYDDLTILNNLQFPCDVTKFLSEYFSSFPFFRFYENYNSNFIYKLSEEKVYSDFEEYEYAISPRTYPSVAELSIYMRTLSVIQFAYAMLGYYFGLPRKFIKQYAKSEISREKMRLLFYILGDDMIKISDIENNLLPDISLDNANKLLEKANKTKLTSYDDIPKYELSLFEAYKDYRMKECCEEYFSSSFFTALSMVYNIRTILTEEIIDIPYEKYYPDEERFKYYIYNLDFSQFAFVMLGYFYGLPQDIIDTYAKKEVSYHNMELLFRIYHKYFMDDISVVDKEFIANINLKNTRKFLKNHNINIKLHNDRYNRYNPMV